MAIVDLESQFTGVVVRSLCAIDLPVIKGEKPRAHGGIHMLMIEAGIEVPEIEKMVLQFSERNISAKLGVTFVGRITQIPPKLIGGPKFWIVGIVRGGLHPERMKVPTYLTIGLCAARLGYDLDDAAAGVAVLRFKSPRLNLHFLDKGLIDAG